MNATTDTQRLDWLIKQGPPGAGNGPGLSDEAWESATMLASDEGFETDAKAVRAFIDLAIEEECVQPTTQTPTT